jgi:hypothetical protein
MTLAYNLPFTAYALKYINYCRLITIPKRRKLKAPLGRWIVPSDQIRQKYNAYWNTTEVYKREDHGITRYKHNMSSITCKVDQVDNIPVDAFPCVITLRNEIITDFSDNFSEQTICEHKPYVYEGIIAVTDASVIGERGTWEAIVTTRNGK